MTMFCNPNGSMNESDDERDLTSLSWLMELRNQNFSWPSVVHSAALDDDVKKRLSVEGGTSDENQQQESKPKANSSKRRDNISTNSNASLNGANNVSPIGNEIVLNKSDERIDDALQDKLAMPIDGYGRSTRRHFNGKCLNKLIKKPTNSLLPNQQPKQQMKRATATERYELFLEKVKRDLEDYHRSAMNYQTDTMEKPPFNYSHIIGMAMLENGRVTLQQICAWIEKKFAFFRVRKRWNNSIRHNLSLHQCFRKIDRKKFEKGKGGYWELGVDPRKSDRKRIRNRKGTQHRNRHPQQQQQLLQQKVMLNPNKIATMAVSATTEITTITKQHNATYNSTFENLQYQEAQPSPSVFGDLPKLQIGNYYSDCSQRKTKEIQSNYTTISANMTNDECTDNADEQLLLDELDIQQNIDIVSCCQQPQQEPEILIGDILQSNASNATTATLNNVSNDSSQQTIQLLQNPQYQQYQLGTIIISRTTNQTGDVSDFAATTGTINGFINEKCINESNMPQQNFLYINDEEISAACDNITVPPYFDNDEAPDKFCKTSNCQTSIQSSTIINCNPDLATNTISAFGLVNSGPVVGTTKNASPVLIGNSENNKKNVVSYSQSPAVIVDQLVQPGGYAIASPLANTTGTTLTIHPTDVGHSGTSFNTELIMASRTYTSPYIDGIEEAFQYLRSMDNNREDILDNFLDISVSDF